MHSNMPSHTISGIDTTCKSPVASRVLWCMHQSCFSRAEVIFINKEFEEGKRKLCAIAAPEDAEAQRLPLQQLLADECGRCFAFNSSGAYCLCIVCARTARDIATNYKLQTHWISYFGLYSSCGSRLTQTSHSFATLNISIRYECETNLYFPHLWSYYATQDDKRLLCVQFISFSPRFASPILCSLSVQIKRKINQKMTHSILHFRTY